MLRSIFAYLQDFSRIRRRPCEAARDGSAPLAAPALASLIADADRARDNGRPALAARLYGNAATAAPDRIDLLVQWANMLKDSGQYAAAESAYLEALARAPSDGDAHLQFGHLLKLMGRRGAARKAYRRAAELLAAPGPAFLELEALGEPGVEEAAFAERERAGASSHLAGIALEISRMRAALDQMQAALPDVRAQAAFPLGQYGLMRALHEVPAPPPGDRATTFAILALIAQDGFDHALELIDSLRCQSHRLFTACLIGEGDELREIVERAGALDPRFVWVARAPGEADADAERRVARASDADWVLLLEPDGVLDPHALAWMCDAAAGGARACIMDSETGVRQAGRLERSEPRFRGPLDPWSVLETNVAGETIAMERMFFREAGRGADGLSLASARALAAMEIARAGVAAHIPHPLVWTLRTPAPGDPAAQLEALRRHLDAHGASGVRQPARAVPTLPLRLRRDAGDADAPIDIVIPTHANADDLAALIASLDALAAAPYALRFRIMANNTPPEARATLDRLAHDPRVTVTPVDEPFNWSRLSNLGARAGTAPLILFANDDMRMLTAEWDAELRGLLCDACVGAVGARLLYPDGTIQHAGVILGWRGGAIHDGLHQPGDAPGPNHRWQVTRAAGAVTGAFLATQRDTFERAGGFDDVYLPIGYSDIDYCLKVQAQGRKVLWTPYITLTHFESKSRGLDHMRPAKAARDAYERAEKTVSASETPPQSGAAASARCEGLRRSTSLTKLLRIFRSLSDTVLEHAQSSEYCTRFQ